MKTESMKTQEKKLETLEEAVMSVLVSEWEKVENKPGMGNEISPEIIRKFYDSDDEDAAELFKKIDPERYDKMSKAWETEENEVGGYSSGAGLTPWDGDGAYSATCERILGDFGEYFNSFLWKLFEQITDNFTNFSKPLYTGYIEDKFWDVAREDQANEAPSYWSPSARDRAKYY